jgi:hypothetical protein
MDYRDADVREFVEHLTERDKPLPGFTYTLRAIELWEEDSRSALDTLRHSGAAAACSLYKHLLDRHAAYAKSRIEFILGYVPEVPSAISTQENTRLADWYACLAEGFDLCATPSGMDLTAEAAQEFQFRYGALVERVARIVMPLERKWARLKKL